VRQLRSIALLGLAACAAAPPPAAAVAPPATASRDLPPDPPCPAGARCRDFADGERAFALVERGWTRAAILALLGGPTSCDPAGWHYEAGNPDGPLLSYTFELAAGRVVAIRHAAAACILRE